MSPIRFAGAILLVLNGCTTSPQSKYDWGNYEQSMYSYYKNPADANALILAIETTIITAETANRSVAPGLYAEYGYLLMMQGKQQDAVANFEKEKRRWPESTHLMDKMTRLAQSQAALKGDVKP